MVYFNVTCLDILRVYVYNNIGLKNGFTFSEKRRRLYSSLCNRQQYCYCNSYNCESSKVSQCNLCSLYLSTQRPYYSGCDRITFVVIHYKSHGNTIWQQVTASKVTDTKRTLQHLNYDEYDVKVAFTNNENITSTSSITTANFLPRKSTFSHIIILIHIYIYIYIYIYNLY